MFKKKSHVTRILEFMFQKPTTFYTIEGIQRFLPEIRSVIKREIETLEKDGFVEARKVWKAPIQTLDPNINPLHQEKGYRLTAQGLVLVKATKQKSFNTKVAVIGITIVALAIPIIKGVKYFESLGAELPSNQVISVPVADSLNTKDESLKIESNSNDPHTTLPAANTR